MIEEAIELMELGVIHFPYEYHGQEYLQLFNGVDNDTGEEIMQTYNLSQEEMLNLSQIDAMKTEICYMHKTSNAENTNVTYALAADKRNIMHDDRAYTFWLLAHRLYELRRGKSMRANKATKDVSRFMQMRAPKLF